MWRERKARPGNIWRREAGEGEQIEKQDMEGKGEETKAKAEYKEEGRKRRLENAGYR